MHAEQQQAARAVMAVHAGVSLREALAAVDDGSERRGRTLVRELAYGTLRHWGTLDAIARRLATKPTSDPLLHALLAVALYQLDHTRAPPFAVVDRAVDAAGMLARPAAKRWLNAILRRYLRERDEVRATVAMEPVARWSHPRWWIARVRTDYPSMWESILEAGNRHPPLALRVNARRSTQATLVELLAHAGIAARAVGSAGVILDVPQPVTVLPGYGEGAFSVQDLGAQLAAPLLDTHPGMRVLDACAAPGGKTSHILEIGDVELTALDRDTDRLARVTANLERLRLDGGNVAVRAGDAGDPTTWWDGRPYDRILADVPCSASGIVRRHPDGKWLRRKTDIAAFAQEQDRLLDALWPLLVAGGKLLYATCSVFAEENGHRIESFLARHSDALRETIMFPPGVAHAGGQLLPSTSAAGHNQDGFFYALLRKA